MIPRNLIVAAAVAGVVGGAYTVWKKTQTPLEKKPVTLRRLPGFTIYLPDNSTDHQQTFEYFGGKLEVGSLGGTNASLHLGWQAGELPDAKGLLEIGRITAKGIGKSASSVRAVPGSDGHTLAIDGDGQLYMSMTQCGSRVIMAVTELAGIAAHKRIVDTISCQPDPDQENAPTKVPLAIELPGFTVGEKIAGQIALEGAGSRVVMRRQPKNEMIRVLTDSLASDFLKAVGVDAILGPRHGEILTFTAKFDDTAQPGLFRFVTCTDSTVLVMAIAVDMPTMNELETRVAAAHCLAPGEAAPTWPDAPKAPLDGLDEAVETDRALAKDPSLATQPSP